MIKFFNHLKCSWVNFWLTEKEVEVFNLLQRVSPETIFCFSIQYAMRNPGVKKFRKMVKELQNESKVHPTAMRRLLGSYTYVKINLL